MTDSRSEFIKGQPVMFSELNLNPQMYQPDKLIKSHTAVNNNACPKIITKCAAPQLSNIITEDS
jgi:hypothetical protein